jgi:hypothetical protein
MAHLAWVETADILRAERAGEQRGWHEQGEQPGFVETGHARSFMHRRIGMGRRACKEAKPQRLVGARGLIVVLQRACPFALADSKAMSALGG